MTEEAADLTVTHEITLNNGLQWRQASDPESGTTRVGYWSEQVKLKLMSDGTVQWENYFELAAPQPTMDEYIQPRIQL